MSEVNSFSANEVLLQGCEPLGEACGLIAQDVQVNVGEEKFNWDTGKWMTGCKAKIGSIACEECGLRRLGVVQDVEVGFELGRDLDVPAEADQPRMLYVMNALPNKLARALFCQQLPR